jgi:hypothetical protein
LLEPGGFDFAAFASVRVQNSDDPICHNWTPCRTDQGIDNPARRPSSVS